MRSRAPRAALAAALWLCGCGGEAACPDRPPGIDRDRCYAAQMGTLGAEQRAEAQVAARAIDDPLIRSEAVIRWISANAAALHPPQGQELCALIDAADRDTCHRRLSSPHLQR